MIMIILNQHTNGILIIRYANGIIGELGITKQEAAKRMNVSQPAYLRYESGERSPSIQMIQTMASVLGTSAEYLMGETDQPSPVSYNIKLSEDPLLFQFVEMYKKGDTDFKNRIERYIEKIKTKTEPTS